MSDHEKLVTWSSLLVHADQAPSLLLATGQYAPTGASERVGLFALETLPRLVADVWLAREDVTTLAEALAKRVALRLGEWDVMYATPWTFAWTDDEGPAAVWDRKGCLLEVRGELLYVRDQRPQALSNFVGVHAYLSPDWVIRGVALQGRDGLRLVCAQEQDRISLFDPTYDGINIMCEAAWAVSLAKALGRSTSLPVSWDEPL